MSVELIELLKWKSGADHREGYTFTKSSPKNEYMVPIRIMNHHSHLFCFHDFVVCLKINHTLKYK